MATVTVSASTTLAALGHGAGDDIVGTGAATLTVNSDPSALPAIRSIRSSDPRFKLYIRNTATTFSAGNLWKVPFENGGSIVGTGGTLAFTGGATCEIEGEWLECYTATGVASETVLDASNVLGVDIDFPYHIEAETAVGSGVYKAVPVITIGGAGNGFIATSLQNRFGTGDVGRVLFYDHTTRLLKVGDGTNGTLFASGIKFRIPNILMWLPPFTLTVGTGGWTAATGSQPVSSSTNAVLNGITATLVYVIGTEILNVSATPTGTTVTVGARAQDLTTATTYTAGTLAYAIPNNSSNMAGKVLSATGGTYILKKCWFSRWWIFVPNNFTSYTADRAGICAPFGGLAITSQPGTFAFTNGVMSAAPSLCRQQVLAASQVGSLSLSGTLMVGVAGVSNAQGYSNLTFASFASVLSVPDMNDVRFWRAGVPSGVSYAGGITFSSTAFPDSGIDGIEVVNLTTTVNDITVPVISGFRYSSTNGAANTTTADIPIIIGGSTAFNNCLFHDFDVISGGLAPYDAWFSIGGSVVDCLFHNKVSGTPRTIDCQGRTRRVASTFHGTRNTLACATFSNMRANSQTQIAGTLGNSCLIRNVRWSDLAGAVVDGNSVFPTKEMVFDFPGGPVNAANASSSGPFSNIPDVQAIYAAPNTWPGLAGGIYIGPVTVKSAKDLYDLSGGAYLSNDSVLRLEASGAVAVVKSTSPVTGVQSVTGTAPVFYGANLTGTTYEFRLCNWGDDITAVSWGTFDGATVQAAFNALTGYSVYAGLDFQLRITTTTAVAGRLLQQCWVPVQMDTAYNPPVSTVPLSVVGASSGSTAAFYYGPSDTLIGTATVSGGGTASIAAPYDFDGTLTDYRIKVRGLSASSEDVSSTYGSDGASVPVPQQSLTGYTAGPYAGASFNKLTKVVTVTTGMTTAQLWSAWREYVTQVANFDVDDTWSYPTLNAPDWTITTSGGGSISGTYADVNGAYVSASISNIVNGSRILIQRTDTNAVLANAIVSGTTYGYTVQTATAIPIKVVLRKASSAPYYQEWTTTGSIEPVGGFAATAAQQPD